MTLIERFHILTLFDAFFILLTTLFFYIVVSPISSTKAQVQLVLLFILLMVLLRLFTNISFKDFAVLLSNLLPFGTIWVPYTLTFFYLGLFFRSENKKKIFIKAGWFYMGTQTVVLLTYFIFFKN